MPGNVWEKSVGFALGQWVCEGLPVLPGGLILENKGLKVLGVFLGNSRFQGKNC